MRVASGQFRRLKDSDDHGHNYLMNVGKFQEREDSQFKEITIEISYLDQTSKRITSR